jgi:hypothetical protein
MGRGGRAGRPPREPPRGGRAIRSASRKVFHSNRSHSCRIHRCNCECGDYTFGTALRTYGLRPKNRPNYDGRGGRGRGWVSLSLSGVASGGVGSPRGTPPRAPVSVYAARTHAHGCTRDGPATRRRRRSTATAGDGRRWRATAGDGRRRHRWSRLWGEQEVRGAVPRAGLGLAPLPRGDSEAVHEPCKSRRPSARRRTCPDGRWSNAEWPG